MSNEGITQTGEVKMNATSSLTILTNSFHNTECRTRKTRDELEAIAWRIFEGTATEAEKSLKRRISRALCGIEGCSCGDSFGERP